MFARWRIGPLIDFDSAEITLPCFADIFFGKPGPRPLQILKAKNKTKSTSIKCASKELGPPCPCGLSSLCLSPALNTLLCSVSAAPLSVLSCPVAAGTKPEPDALETFHKYRHPFQKSWEKVKLKDSYFCAKQEKEKN